MTDKINKFNQERFPLGTKVKTKDGRRGVVVYVLSNLQLEVRFSPAFGDTDTFHRSELDYDNES